jgi:cytochrome c5
MIRSAPRHALVFAVLAAFAFAGIKAVRDPSSRGTRRPAAVFSYDALQRLLDVHPELRAPEDLIPLLPEDCRSNFNLMYQSRSLQGGDWDNPRVILDCGAGRLVLGYTGLASQANGDRVELLRFDEGQKAFFTGEITFTAAGARIEDSPQACIKCHGNPARPVWDSYDLWPGAYGSAGDLILVGSEEEKHFRSFLSLHQGKDDRYRSLIGLYENRNDSNADYYISVSTLQGHLPSNTRLGVDLSNLNIEHVKHQVDHAQNLAQLRYAALGALVGCGAIDEFFPAAQWAELHARFPKSLRHQLVESMNQTARSYFFDRLQRQGGVAKSGALKGVLRPIDPTLKSYEPLTEKEGRGRVSFRDGFVAVRELPLRILMKWLGIEIEDWFMTREPGSYDSGDGQSGLEGGLALRLLRELSVKDSGLANMIPIHNVDVGPYAYDEIDFAKLFGGEEVQSYSKEEKQQAKQEGALMRAFAQGPVCRYLKDRSQGVLREDARQIGETTSGLGANFASSKGSACKAGQDPKSCGRAIVENQCVDCHSAGKHFIPFMNSGAFSGRLHENGDALFKDAIRRLQSKDPAVRMPYGDSLSDDEERAVEAYLNSL